MLEALLSTLPEQTEEERNLSPRCIVLKTYYGNHINQWDKWDYDYYSVYEIDPYCDPYPPVYEEPIYEYYEPEETYYEDPHYVEEVRVCENALLPFPSLVRKR